VSGAQVAIKTSKLQIMFPRHNTRLYKDAYKSLIKTIKYHTRSKINEMENLRKTKAAQNAHYLLKIMEVVGLQRDLALDGLPCNDAIATQDGVDVSRTYTERTASEVVPPVTPHSNTLELCPPTSHDLPVPAMDLETNRLLRINSN
jgi:hypothetical protein